MTIPRKSIGKSLVMGRDLRVLQFLFEHKVLSREQIHLYFFSGVAKRTVNRRLRKILNLGLIKQVFIPTRQGPIYGYSLTQRGVNQIKFSLPYKVNGKSSQSYCPLHDMALVNIRKAFEARNSVQGYYTENVLQTCSDFKEGPQFRPFVDLKSDGLAFVETKIGVLNLAIEFDAHRKSHQRYRKKIDDYYWNRKVDGVLYICSHQGILNALLRADKEVTHSHHCESKVYFALLDDVTNAKKEMIFRNVEKYIFKVY